jgi:hypothetical protein
MDLYLLGTEYFASTTAGLNLGWGGSLKIVVKMLIHFTTTSLPDTLLRSNFIWL